MSTKDLKKIKVYRQAEVDFCSSGRFPRAWLQSPRHCVPAGLSAQAHPAGVVTLRKNQLFLLSWTSRQSETKIIFFYSYDKVLIRI